MLLDPQGREVVRQRRCDSPAPRATNAIDAAAANPGMTQSDPVRVLNKSKKTQTSAPSLSTVMVLAIALLLGRAALINEAEELGDSPTWTALVIFLAVGAAVMRFDFMEFTKEEARKEGLRLEPASTPWLWLLLVLLLGAAVAWNRMTAPRHPTSTTVAGPVTIQKLWQPELMNQLYLHDEMNLRAAKLKYAPEDLENIVGRDLDTSLVLQTDAHMTVAARRSARKEVAAIGDLTSENCILASTSLRWRISMQVTDEISIFFVSLAIAIGLATAVSDLVEMIHQAQEEDTAVAAVEYPEAEKIHKPSSSSSRWRLLACTALLLAVVAGFVSSLGEDM